MINNTSYIL